jgi:hypothetical protein
MQAVHECGHVLGAWFTGASVANIVLHPLTISRTVLLSNPHPLLVVWAGPVLGVLLPLVGWGLASLTRIRIAFLARFFAGFCLVANGAYIGIGSFDGIGDCGEMIRHGAVRWQLWLFGIVSIPAGILLWHNQGAQFGFGAAQGHVNRRIAYLCLLALCLLVTVEVAFGSR